jgi:putative nucleotidyltransferase with HDIG domain
VFDYEPTVESSVKRGVRSAFAQMRAIVESHTKPAPVDAAKKPVKDPKEEAELVQALRDAKSRFLEHATPPENDDFEALVQARFSTEVEQGAVGLIELAYRSKLVISRSELSRIDGNGITTRLVGGTSEAEGTTTAPVVLDINEASAELDRYASVPGNLLSEASSTLRGAVLRLARRQLRANLTVNIAETEARKQAAWAAVKPVLISVKKGQRVIGDGELVNETHLLIVKSLRTQTNELEVFATQFGGLGMIALVVGAAWLFFQAALRRFRPLRRDALFMGLLSVALLGALHVWVLISDAVHDRYPSLPIEALYFAFPVAAGAMLVRFVLSDESSLFFGLVFSILAGIMLGNSLPFFLFGLVTSLFAAERIGKAKDRAGIFKAGLRLGVLAWAMVIFLSLAGGRGFGLESVLGGLAAFASSAFVVPMLVLTLTPLVEAAFGYASDLKLLELANLNHPALKELVLQAPGTYHHSIIMGSLVEAAAEAIGANPLLARSCAYYHDIGKGRNPAYFGENQKGENAHDTLAPAMSAVIIKRHVTEGLEMARQFKLPRRVADAIPQHHGTRLVGYFYHRAQKLEDAKEHPQSVDDAQYRYPGPKPQFRETALVMIADAVEAASRSLPQPTPEQLLALVQKMINMIFSEGQLDECDLTLKDLHLIAHSFARTLEGIYHARPAYPAGAFSGGRPPGPDVLKPLTVVKKSG